MDEATFYRQRLAPLRKQLQSEGKEAFWVTNLCNIRYLTGFTGSSAEVFVTPEETLFITDGRYQEQVQSEVHGCRIRVFTKGIWSDVLLEEAGANGWKSIVFEAEHLSCNGLSKVQSLPEPLGNAEWIPSTRWVEGLRVAKDEIEIDTLERSSRVVDEVFAALLPEFRVGVTEKQILRRMLNLLWEHGASGASFDPIVLFGARSSLPHGQPGDKPLSKGDWVLLDFGAVLEGYCSDCTRTFVYGEPDELQKERHDLVSRAHQAGIEAAQPGVPCREVDSAARKVLEEAGVGSYFIHGLGHGIGLEIHESPRLTSTSEETLGEGMVVTIEPGIYLPEWGGIRIEDAVVVKGEGSSPLTGSDRTICPLEGR